MPDPFSYAGRRVVVTGGATGVGAALLELLAEIGAPEVVVLDIKAPSAPHTTFVEVDLADERAVDAAVGAVDGDIDALFNNAGVNSTSGLRTTMAVNYLALRRLSEGLLHRIRPGGAIVNTASTAGQRWDKHPDAIRELIAVDGWDAALDWVEVRTDLFTDVYPFSKEVVQYWTMHSARATGRRQVRTNSICPAPIDTPLLSDFRRTMTDKVIDWNIGEALGRVMRPSEAASALAFLGSEAASYINGVNLLVDGGFYGSVNTGQVDWSGLR